MKPVTGCSARKNDQASRTFGSSSMLGLARRARVELRRMTGTGCPSATDPSVGLRSSNGQHSSRRHWPRCVDSDVPLHRDMRRPYGRLRQMLLRSDRSHRHSSNCRRSLTETLRTSTAILAPRGVDGCTAHQGRHFDFDASGLPLARRTPRGIEARLVRPQPSASSVESGEPPAFWASRIGTSGTPDGY